MKTTTTKQKMLKLEQDWTRTILDYNYELRVSSGGYSCYGYEGDKSGCSGYFYLHSGSSIEDFTVDFALYQNDTVDNPILSHDLISELAQRPMEIAMFIATTRPM